MRLQTSSCCYICEPCCSALLFEAHQSHLRWVGLRMMLTMLFWTCLRSLPEPGMHAHGTNALLRPKPDWQLMAAPSPADDSRSDSITAALEEMGARSIEPLPHRVRFQLPETPPASPAAAVSPAGPSLMDLQPLDSKLPSSDELQPAAKEPAADMLPDSGTRLRGSQAWTSDDGGGGDLTPVSPWLRAGTAEPGQDQQSASKARRALIDLRPLPARAALSRPPDSSVRCLCRCCCRWRCRLHVLLASLACCSQCLTGLEAYRSHLAWHLLQATSSLTLEEGPEQDQQLRTLVQQPASAARLRPAGSDPLPERAQAWALHRQVRWWCCRQSPLKL